MTNNEKINICQSIMDELSVIGYLDNSSCIMKTYEFVQSEINTFDCGIIPACQAEKHLQDAKNLVNDSTVTKVAIIERITEIIEKALTVLHSELEV